MDPRELEDDRDIPATGDEMRDNEFWDTMIKRQEIAFEEKFGRMPGPDDPLWFDPDLDEPTPMSGENTMLALREAADAAGLDLQDILKSMGWGE